MMVPKVSLLAIGVALVVGCGDSPSTTGSGRSALDSAGAVEALPTEPGALSTEVARTALLDDRRNDADLDEDGFAVDVDPDDENPLVFPGAPDRPCNGVDEDGDGADACAPDADGDGARSDTDCNDGNAGVGPLAIEVRCNGQDENCDGFDDCDMDDDGVLDWADPDPNDPTPPREQSRDLD